MRLLVLSASALALTACSSPRYFAANDYHQTGHHAGHQSAATYYGAAQQGVYGNQQLQNTHYGVGSGYNVSGPVDVYPSGIAHNKHAGHHAQAHHGIPALRGSHAHAQNRPQYYGNLGAVMYDVDEDAYGAIGRLGVQQGRLGAEAEGSLGIINESRNGIVLDNNGQPVNVRSKAGVNYSTGLFGVVRQPLSQRLNVLARGGYHYTELGAKARTETGQRASVTDTIDGFAYGAGVEYYVDPKSGLRFDYTRYENNGSNASDTIAATYFQRF